MWESLTVLEYPVHIVTCIHLLPEEASAESRQDGTYVSNMQHI